MKLRLGRWRFAPGLWPTAAMLVLLVATVSLGNWQRERASAKQAMQQRYDDAATVAPRRAGGGHLDADQVRYHPLVMHGHFDDTHTILLDNRVRNGVAGYHVLTPFHPVEGGHAMLVNRGWLAPGPTRAAIAAPPVPTGIVVLEGIAVDAQSRYVELGDAAPQGRVWQNLDFPRYAQQTGLALQPVLLLQRSAAPDGLLRDWPRLDTGVDVHVAYALQWYGLAATLAVLWLVLNVERARDSGREEAVA